MPADLDIREDGSAVLAVAEQPAWHGLGELVNRRIDRADLDLLVPEWVAEVERRPLYGMLNGAMAESATHVQNVRKAHAKGGEATVGIVGKRRYQLVQNTVAFDLAAGILGLREDAQVASVGTLRGGAVTFISLYLGRDELIPGAPSELRDQYLTFVNSFDASYALTGVNSDTRVVCTNTLRWNLAQPRKVTIRHTGDMEVKLDEARRALELHDAYARNQARVAQALAAATVKRAQAEAFFNRLVPYPTNADGTEREGRALTNAKQLREAIANLYWTNPTVAPVRDTAWGLMQAVTYYTNHQQQRRNTATSSPADNRFEALVLDDSAPLEARAQRLLTAQHGTALAKALA